MKRFKYQALVTPAPSADGEGKSALSGTCRMVVEAHHRESGTSKLFGALVVTDANPSPGAPQLSATLQLVGDDAGEYLAPGDTFGLWREGHVADGIVTRRVFI